MTNEIYAHSAFNALRTILRRRRRPAVERKFRQFEIWTGPLVWGPWTEVWAQVGVIGPNADQHVSHVRILFDTKSMMPSPFQVEIEGGDRAIRTTGPGEENVTVTGNVATAIKVRFKSATQGQIVFVTVQ